MEAPLFILLVRREAFIVALSLSCFRLSVFFVCKSIMFCNGLNEVFLYRYTLLLVMMLHALLKCIHFLLLYLHRPTKCNKVVTGSFRLFARSATKALISIALIWMGRQVCIGPSRYGGAGHPSAL